MPKKFVKQDWNRYVPKHPENTSLKMIEAIWYDGTVKCYNRITDKCAEVFPQWEKWWAAKDIRPYRYLILAEFNLAIQLVTMTEIDFNHRYEKHSEKLKKKNKMNKLLFKLQRDFNDDITLITNNHKDLEDYLNENYDWHKIEVKEDSVIIKEREGYENDIALLEWVKHI